MVLLFNNVFPSQIKPMLKPPKLSLTSSKALILHVAQKDELRDFVLMRDVKTVPFAASYRSVLHANNVILLANSKN